MSDLIQEILIDRLNLMKSIIFVFKSEFEPSVSKYIERGPLQKQILKKHNLPVTGPNMRLVNESLELLGYRKVFVKGYPYFTKG